MSILIVEDDQDISTLLKRGFELEGYQVDCAGSGEEAMGKIAAKPYVTMILDVMLPRQSGLDVCKDVRDSGNDLTVIMLSARDAVPDRIEGLSAGADDYVIKPFEFSELLARVKAHERRGRGRREADDDRIDAEVVGHAGSHPGDGAVAALEAAVRRDRCLFHVSIVTEQGPGRYRVRP